MTVLEEDIRFVVCLNNAAYSASLELHKIYQLLPDKGAELDGDFRIVDEDGEDYLYSAEHFIRVELPQAVDKSL